MQRVYYKSDFDFILKMKDTQGNDLGWPDFDWELKLYTNSKVNAFVVSCKSGEAVNCYNDNGKIHVVADNHGLGVGKMSYELIIDKEDDTYEDGYKREVIPGTLAIELTNSAGDSDIDISVAPNTTSKKDDDCVDVQTLKEVIAEAFEAHNAEIKDKVTENVQCATDEDIENAANEIFLN